MEKVKYRTEGIAPSLIRLAALVGAISTPLLPGALSAQAKTYYVSQASGDDAASGLAAQAADGAGPWKTLAKVAAIQLAAGDRVLLKCGDTWNEELAPKGNGTPANPIVISSYGTGAKPIIDRQNPNEDLFGIHLADQEGFKIAGIEFARCMTGIYAEYSDNCPTKKFIWIEDCYFRDSPMYRHYENYPKTKIGLGICYDMRFAHLSLLYGQLGCKMIVFPGAFNTTTGPSHWELLLRARAIDSQVRDS